MSPTLADPLSSLSTLLPLPHNELPSASQPPSQLQGLLAREWDQALTFSFPDFLGFRPQRLRGRSRPRPIKTKVHKEPGFDFIDFMGQFGAILYSMVLFLLLFMLIFHRDA